MAGCRRGLPSCRVCKGLGERSCYFYKINVEGTKNVLDAAREARVEKIVFTSTAGVLGPSASKPVSESDKRIGDVMNEYGDSKTKAELLCTNYHKTYGMHIVTVNPPRVYGPGVESESNAVTQVA